MEKKNENCVCQKQEKTVLEIKSGEQERVFGNLKIPWLENNSMDRLEDDIEEYQGIF